MTEERFLQFIWKERLVRKDHLRTLQGERVIIMHPGEWNLHAGPDFFNARIMIGSILWAGNVELHHRASDWNRHGHHLDPAYNNVILHVARIPDGRVFNSLGREIPCLITEYPPGVKEVYRRFRTRQGHLSCSSRLPSVPPRIISAWIDSLLRERLANKTARISRLLEQKKGDWEETLYVCLAAGYGLPVNLLPFEMLASGLPLGSLVDLRDNRFALEALLFGQAGLLATAPGNSSHVRRLREIYRELHHPSLCSPVPGYLWKFLRLRPASFPTLRISQFAGLIQRQFPMLQDILNPGTLPEMEQMFRIGTSAYWDNHYLFGKRSRPVKKNTGTQCILSLIINEVVPFLYVYGKREKKRRYMDLCHDILKELKSESNHITKKWISSGVKPTGAYESQALIQLYNHYCSRQGCLECRVGRWIFESSSTS